MNEHPMLAKIRKLLAKAENDAATPEEAEAYTAKAAELIAAYGIDQTLLAADSGAPLVVGDRVIGLEAPYARDKADLLATVAAHYGCQAVQVAKREPGTTSWSLHLFGQQSDLERTELLFTSLLLQAATWMVRAPVPRGEHQAAFRRSWLAGFRGAVGERLAYAEARAQADASAQRPDDRPGTALVLADRAAVAKRAMQEAYPRLRSARARQLSGSGAADGWDAGQRADLGGRRMAAPHRRRLGWRRRS
ncbi:DUF2786 domain-containing protein [Nocardioides sp. Bht2]|uniref:DUF2786 domain-containing protein n=1 Tax=Nocardioides sp. Bht2 TaxID=3392297 RepID=UPI0039B5F808